MWSTDFMTIRTTGCPAFSSAVSFSSCALSFSPSVLMSMKNRSCPYRAASPSDSTSTDRWIAVEDACKTLSGCDLLQRRAGIGHRDEAVTGLVGADRLGNLREEIILHHVRLGGAAGFAGNDEQGFGDVDRSPKMADLPGVGRVEHMQLRESGFWGKRLRQQIGRAHV